MKILIAIPIYISNDLHLEFTQKTVDSIKSSHEHDIVLINNFCASDEYLTELKKIARVVDNPKGNILSAAWNQAIDMTGETSYDYLLISNNDLIFKSDCIDNLVKFAEEYSEYIMWTAAEHESLRELETYQSDGSYDEHPHFSCFMIKPAEFVLKMKLKEKNTKEPIPGYFDEGFSPAYFEDGDMHNRILRAGYKASKTSTALFYHYGSRTIKSDDILNKRNNRTYETNRAYFVKKWGWDPHGRVVEADDKVRYEAKEPFEQSK